LKIYDISITVTPDIVTWDNAERGHSTEWLSHVNEESVAAVSVQSYGSHTGTHLDAPRHFVAGGATLEALDINDLVGPVQVVEVEGDSVTAEALERSNIPEGTERIIFKTRNTARKLLDDAQFHRDYVGVAPDAARWLVDRGVRLVGIDYLSIGPYGGVNVETHRILLGAGIIAVEGLALQDVAPGRYFLAALPPKVSGVEGSPCRAILIEGIG
jgi:arylformamidase